ncbi:LysM peptidoglycan-binding domain-containing protein [Agromyces subbeticus]|uniref:LysM peptidoglycan-binding domain-containing protein n=1 Tax=Agromyces subbeticus TaxID=293890 RepID=UPI0003B3B716|nr:LysM peptidoglycan-binding domain-containing protein [Agromyces subbeticus]
MSAAIATTGFQPARARQAEATMTPPRSRLRLTRRGRVVFTGLASVPLIVWAFIAVLGSGVAAADIDSAGSSFEAASFEYVTVGQGDSLWAIAESVDPHADVREVIDEIMRLNALDDAVVEPGQRLALPVVP